jgi:prophage regulatory protein
MIQPPHAQPAARLLPMTEVQTRTSLSRASLWRLIRAGRFPSGISLGVGTRIAWREADVSAWIESLTTGQAGD